MVHLYYICFAAKYKFFKTKKKSLPFGETLAEEHSGTLLLAEDEDVTGQLVRDATIFANKEVVIMLLQSIAAFLRIPAGSDANTVRIALNDEENVASLHLHYGCGFAVLTSAVNSLANTIAHGHNAVVVNFGVSVEIVCHSNSQLGKFGRINSTFASTFECMAGKQHVVHVFEALMFYFAASNVPTIRVVYFV